MRLFKIFPVLILIFISSSASALENANRVARLYCSYEIRGKSNYFKLINPKNNQSYKVASRFDDRLNSYLIDVMDYYRAVGNCFSQVQDAKILNIQLKANNGKKFESSQILFNGLQTVIAVDTDGRFRSVSQKTFDSGSSIDDQISALEKDEIDALLEKVIDRLKFVENHDDLLEISKALDLITKQGILADIGLSISYFTDSYGSTAFIIAATLASTWVQGPYVAGLTEAIYPHIYGLLYGSVPSAYSPSYWAFYYPGMKHTSNFAFNNSHLIAPVLLNSGYAAYKSVYKAVSRLSEGIQF